MKTIKLTSALFFSLALSASPSFGESLSGNWKDVGGAYGGGTVQIKQSGNRLTGSYRPGEFFECTFEGGKCSGTYNQGDVNGPFELQVVNPDRLKGREWYRNQWQDDVDWRR